MNIVDEKAFSIELQAQRMSKSFAPEHTCLSCMPLASHFFQWCPLKNYNKSISASPPLQSLAHWLGNVILKREKLCLGSTIFKILNIPRILRFWTAALNWPTSGVLIRWIASGSAKSIRFHCGIFGPPSAILEIVLCTKGKCLRIDLMKWTFAAARFLVSVTQQQASTKWDFLSKRKNIKVFQDLLVPKCHMLMICNKKT